MANFPSHELFDTPSHTYKTMWVITLKDNRQLLCDECTEIYNESKKRQEYKLRVISLEYGRYLSDVKLEEVEEILELHNVRFTLPWFDVDHIHIQPDGKTKIEVRFNLIETEEE